MRVSPMKIVWTIVTLAIGVVALLSVKPSLLPASAHFVLKTPGSQIIALRGWLVVAFAVAALFMVIVGIIRKATIRRGGFALLIGAILLVTAGLHGATMYSRGLANPGRLGPDQGVTVSSPGNGAITVLQYNTLGGKTNVIDIVELVQSNGVDVVTLPETSSQMGADIVAELGVRGLSFQQFDTGTSGYDADYDSTVLLVSSDLGSYTSVPVFDSAAGMPAAVRAVSSDGTGPDLIAVHPIAPSNTHIEKWRAQIAATYGLCTTYPNAIISGDFNSTVDHQAALGLADACADAGAQAGSGAVGTWSTSIPSFFGSPIDRVLAPHTFTGTDAAIVDVGKSDHRGLLVRLTPVS